MCPQDLQSELLHNLYPPTGGNATTNETGRLGSMPCRAEKRTQHFCWKSEVNNPLVRPSRKEEDNIKNDVEVLKPKNFFYPLLAIRKPYTMASYKLMCWQLGQ